MRPQKQLFVYINTLLRLLPLLLHRDLGMLDGERHPFLREVEHIKDDRFVARVHAAVNGTDHLNDGFPGMHDLLLAVNSDDGQFPLMQNAVVDDGVMMPRKLAADRKI